jgi:hypothetical protein
VKRTIRAWRICGEVRAMEGGVSEGNGGERLKEIPLLHSRNNENAHPRPPEFVKRVLCACRRHSRDCVFREKDLNHREQEWSWRGAPRLRRKNRAPLLWHGSRQCRAAAPRLPFASPLSASTERTPH